MDQGFMEYYIPNNIEGAGLYTGNYADAYALELSRELAAFSAYIYAPVQVQTIYTYEQQIGSRIQIVPFVLYLAANFIFGIASVYIGVCALASFLVTPNAGLGHNRITSPLSLFYYRFGPVDVHGTWEKDEDMFKETEGDRLSVGVYDVNGVPVFQIEKDAQQQQQQ